MACETKTRSPQTMGDEFPRPGRSTRQRTFSLVPHLRGKLFSVETPVPSGPRQPGQLLAEAVSGIERIDKVARPKAIEVFMVFEGWSGGQFASWSSGRAAPGVALRSSRMMTLSR